MVRRVIWIVVFFGAWSAMAGVLATPFGGYGLIEGLPKLVVSAVALVLVIMIFIAGQLIIGQRSMRLGQAQVPVDLAGVPTLESASLAAAYETLPLAQRNALVAVELARASGHSVETIADLLPDMMGRNRISNLATQNAAAAVRHDLRVERVDADRVRAICAAEVDLAAQVSLPRDDRVRALVEARTGLVADRTTMATSIRRTRLPALNMTVGDLIDEVVRGQRDLAFVVGTIRKVGEFHAAEMAKIR